MSEKRQKYRISVKDEINVESDSYQLGSPQREACDICLKTFENEPKILCAECRAATSICLQCFALGLETQTHRCDHKYRIDCRHIPVDPDTDWSPQEDFDLLQRVQEYGYGNDVDLHKGFMHRTFDDIRLRIDQLLGLDKAPLQACLQVGKRTVVPYNSEVAKHDPPRYPYRSAHSKQLAGYCAPRGDFETEHANNAEEMLKHLCVTSDEDSEGEESDGLSDEITCALVQCYNEKLKERIARRNVVKTYGLLSKRSSWLTWPILNQHLSIFMQLMNLEEYDTLLAGMNRETSLKMKMRKYRKYRSLGITRLKACTFYDKLEAIRTQESNNLHRTLQIMDNIKRKAPMLKRSVKPPPIDVSIYPGYSSLLPSERELCSNIRILPEKYLQFKSSLMEICRQEGGVRLGTARSALKIDVNKTRQIYNCLCDEGFITSI